MSDALDHVEATLTELSRAQARLKQGKGSQVRTAGEREFLKSTALAWLQTHRRHLHGVSLERIDKAYHRILDASERMSARATYVSAFKDAKSGLLEVRKAVASAPLVSADAPSAPPPAFSNLSGDPQMQLILQRRWNEIQLCISSGANLSATVMMGGLLESLLLARINLEKDKKKVYGSRSTPKDRAGKPQPLAQWKLVDMVSLGHEVGWLSKSAKDVGNVLREFRNYIHPHKEHTDGVSISSDDVKMFWEVSKVVSLQVLKSIP